MPFLFLVNNFPLSSLISYCLSFRCRPRPVLCHSPSDPIPPPAPHVPPPLIFSPLHPLILLCHTRQTHLSFTPRRSVHSGSQWASFSTFSVSLSGRALSITQSPSHTHHLPFSVCGDRVHPGWVSFLCMVCDQWCHSRCSGIHSPADYWRLFPWSCPYMLHPSPTCSAHQGAGVLRLGVNTFDPIARPGIL